LCSKEWRPTIANTRAQSSKIKKEKKRRLGEKIYFHIEILNGIPRTFYQLKVHKYFIPLNFSMASSSKIVNTTETVKKF
jgi:hypothetical protein